MNPMKNTMQQRLMSANAAQGQNTAQNDPEFEALVDEIEVDDFFFFCGRKKFFIGCFPRTRWNAQERELIPHIGRHLGSAFFIAQRQQRFKNAIIPHGVNLPF